MRGAGMRLGLDVRRLWRCPQCGAERKLPADVTTVRCSACSGSPFMQIVEPQRRPRPTPKPLNPFITIDLDAPEEGEARSASPAAAVIPEQRSADMTVVESTAPAAPATPNERGGPPPKRHDRRGKNRRQRDRQGKPDRPPQDGPASSPAESPAAMNPPDAAPAAPPASPPDAGPPAES